MSIDRQRIGIFIFATILGMAVAWFGQPLIHNNERAVNVIVTTFSILAGFLIAIMTIISDPSVFGRRTWRAAEIGRKSVYQKLVRQKWLFVAYLITLALIFLESLLIKRYTEISLWLEHIYLFLGTVAFIFSLRLPSTLMNIQIERHEQFIDHKRKKKI